jgi:beta-1,4-mannosyl-glycoprotein beta-1,4-N-acetylglucosaminyltransferase
MVVDCFTFFNELDLLEIRLNILNETVDRFVLVEATRTFQNNPKPLYFNENKKRFEAFLPKITHIIVDDYPRFFSRNKSTNAWILERYQRSCIARGLTTCKGDDTIIVSDLDEIPNPEVLLKYKDRRGIQVFEQWEFCYFLNSRQKDFWYGTVMAHFRDFRHPQELRSVSKKMHGDRKKILDDKFYRFIKAVIHPIYRKPIFILPRAGWHFSFLGGVDKVIEKIEAFAHTEHNLEATKDRQFILDAMQTDKYFLIPGAKLKTIKIDETFPAYIYNNQEKYKHLINTVQGG